MEVDWGLWGEFDRAVEAGFAAGVAGTGSFLSDDQDEGILIAVGSDFVDCLSVS